MSVNQRKEKKMLIISEDRQVIVNFNNCVDAFIHPIKTKILCGSIANGPQKEIGVYDSREKVNRAFGFLIRAISEDVEVFAMLRNGDERLNTSLRNNGGFRTLQTNGKTK